MGYVDVSSKHTDFGLRTAIGVGLGALLGAVVGPIGVAAGIAGAAGLATGTAVGVGVVVGGLAGVTSEANKADDRSEAEQRTLLILNPTQYAVLAEVTEVSEGRLDGAMNSLGGTVHRRPSDDVRYYDYGPGYYSNNYRYPYYNNYLYPYYAEPVFD
jgi:hypothetical protein